MKSKEEGRCWIPKAHSLLKYFTLVAFMAPRIAPVFTKQPSKMPFISGSSSLKSKTPSIRENPDNRVLQAKVSCLKDFDYLWNCRSSTPIPWCLELYCEFLYFYIKLLKIVLQNAIFKVSLSQISLKHITGNLEGKWNFYFIV